MTNRDSGGYLDADIDAANTGVEEGTQSKNEDPEFGNDSGEGTTTSSRPFIPGNIVERVNQTIRKRNVPQPQNPDKVISLNDKQYDIDGDGILDENEKMLKDLYKGGDISAKDVYDKLTQLSAVKKKYANAKFFLLLAIIFCAFTIASNFAMSFVAMHISKELKVSFDGKIQAAGGDDKENDALATRSLGLVEKASLTDPGIADGSNGRNRNIRRLSFASASKQCTLEDFDPFFSEENLIGKLPMASCKKIWNQASSGTRPINIEVELNSNIYGHTLNDFRTIQNNGIECSFFNVFAGKSENWFFRGCEDECDFFITSSDKIPLPDCLDDPSIVSVTKEENESCEKDRECQGDLQCLSVGQGINGEYKVCIDVYKSVASRTPLPQEVFNHIGPLTEISKALFKEIEKAGKVNEALIVVDQSPADYAVRRASLVEEGDDEYQTLFVRESGCTRLLNRSDRCIPASELLTLLNSDPLQKQFKFSKGSISRGDLEKEYHYARKLDMSVVEKFGDICYGTFRGTVFTSLVDWTTNLDPNVEDIETDQGICTVRKGFNRAFWAESELWGEHPEDDYPEGMETAIRNCVNMCSDGPCTVVLTGHSQGGALATIAAILLQDLNPVVITFASPGTLVPNTDGVCPVLDKDRLFRIVATRRSESGELRYDPVPYLALPIGDVQVGHEIRLTSESPTSAAYFYQQLAGVNIFKTSVSLHFLAYYVRLVTNLKEHFERSSAPIQLGFANGLGCSKNLECASNNCERLDWPADGGRECREKLGANELCNTNDSCISGRCENQGFFKKICKDVLPVGSACSDYSDCESGRCEEEVCEEKLENEKKCSTDEDCQSGRCENRGITWFASNYCEPKLDAGNKCNEPSDCKSNTCRNDFCT